jgi:hypothetical protein
MTDYQIKSLNNKGYFTKVDFIFCLFPKEAGSRTGSLVP